MSPIIIDMSHDGYRLSGVEVDFDLDADGAKDRVVLPLADSGVVSIDLNYRWFGKRDRHGNLFKYGSQITILNREGKPIKGMVYDIFLGRAPEP